MNFIEALKLMESGESVKSIEDDSYYCKLVNYKVKCFNAEKDEVFEGELSNLNSGDYFEEWVLYEPTKKEKVKLKILNDINKLRFNGNYTYNNVINVIHNRFKEFKDERK